MRARKTLALAGVMLLACASSGSDHIRGEQSLTGRVRFTVAETGQPLRNTEILYVIDRKRAKEFISRPASHEAESDAFFEYRTDEKGEVVVMLAASYSGFVPTEDGDPPEKLYISPFGLIRARLGDQWLDVPFPHMDQNALVRVEWLETLENQEKKDMANQALQTTPMTRSVYEKTIEFGYTQRGV